MTRTHDAVIFERVTKHFGDVKAVDTVSLSVAHGEFVTLLGPSGSGKTTLLNLVAGAQTPDSGRVLIDGRDMTHVPPHRRNIGMVFQRYTLFPNKTVAENIAFPLNVRKLGRAETAKKVEAALDLVELRAQAGRYPSEVSGGQAQRVAVARALVFEPSLLLMDEPLGALDKSLREILQEEIRRIQQETHIPTLYVTHDQDEAMSMSDRIIIFRSGHIVANGSPRTLYSCPSSLWAARFLGEVNTLPVTAIAATGEMATIGLGFAAETVRGRMGPGVTQADRLVAVVRPERCRVARGKPDGEVSFPGRVVNCTFLGSRQRVDVRLDGGLQLRAVMPGVVEVGAPGDVVHVWWDREAAQVVCDDLAPDASALVRQALPQPPAPVAMEAIA